jgi:hypothetical protein
MGLGTITLLGMLCTPGQAPADTTTWNSPSMKIPIDYNPNKKGEIKELLLYVSTDQGASWQQQAVAAPDRDAFFNYDAKADGVVWFNMVVVDKTGRREPPDVFKAAPALKVLFDTKKPVVSITSAQRNGDDVVVAWKIIEKNPDWSKFKLEYSMNGTNWTPVSTRPEADGSAQFKVAGSGNLTVRVALTDLAGLTGEASSPVAGTTTVAAKTIPEGGVGVIATTSGTGNNPLPTITGGNGPASDIMPPPPPTSDRAITRPTETRGMETTLPLPPAPGTAEGPPRTTPTDSIVAPVGPAPHGDPVGVTMTASNLPAPQVINVTSFKMAYEVEDKGASGVGKAEIWVTRDDGHTWSQWSVVDKPESPLLIDLAKTGNTQVEGVYGFKILLQSGAGLSREAPKSGEAPDLRIDVDVTAPTLTLFEPVPDKSQKDTLILRWQAADRNLANDPITLEWAEGPRGPWYPIAASEGIGSSPGLAKRLANTGAYSWKLPANFPTHKVYLKATARDTAGNVCEVTSNQPVLVDLNKPAAVKLNIVGGR